MIVAFAWWCAALAGATLAVALSNVGEFTLVGPGRGRTGCVVCCIAMRDEAANARECLRSLLAQPEVMAIVVADDGSRDDTYQILRALSERDDRVQVLRAASGADGRGSKSAALAAAARAASQRSPRYLLFTDADVRFEAGAIGGVLAIMRARNVQAVSGWPRVEAGTLWDRWFGALVIGLLIGALPMRAARRSDPRIAAANGQMLLVERASYERCGGHATIGSLVEDVALARALKSAGSRIALCSLARVARTRGYGSFGENLRGYGRSLFFGAGAMGSLLYGAWQLCAVAAPWLLMTRVPIPAALGVMASLLSRAIVGRMSGEPLAAALAAPLEGSCGAFGGCAAAYLGTHDGFSWRGRVLRRQV